MANSCAPVQPACAIKARDKEGVIEQPLRQQLLDFIGRKEVVDTTADNTLRKRKRLFLHDMIQLLPTLSQFNKAGPGHQYCHGNRNPRDVGRLDVQRETQRRSPEGNLI